MATAQEELSEREREILRLVATGASNKEIAAELRISANTVKVHLRNVFAKMAVRSRTEATMAAIELGLIRAPGARVQGDAASTPAGTVAGEAAHVFWWQKLTLVVVATIALALAAWPRGVRLTSPEVMVDPLSDIAATATGLEQQQVGRWREAAQMPTGRARFASAMVGRQVVVIGGDSAEGVTSAVEIYDTEANTWRLGASKPVAVSNVSAVVVEGLVYVPGGYTAGGSVTGAMEVYDVQHDEWLTGPPLPHPLCAYAMASDGLRLYVFGGWDGHAYVDSAYSLEPGASEWSSLQAMPRARGHAGVAVLRGEAYGRGGYDGRQVRRDVDGLTLDAADSRQWREGPPLLEARAGLGAAAIGDAIYVVGGGWAGTLSFSEKLTSDGGGWQTWETPLLGPWRNMGVVADQTTVYAMGGWREGILANVYRYQAVYRFMLPVVSR